MLIMVMCVLCSALTATVIIQILATRYFEIVDGYVKDMVELTKKSIRDRMKNT